MKALPKNAQIRYLTIFLLFTSFFSNAQECITGTCVDGEGTYVYSDGSKYIGEFKNSNADGFGVCFYANGTKYIGQFKDHTCWGHGAWYDKEGVANPGYYNEKNEFVSLKDLSKGCIQGDCYSGFGTQYYEEGTVYIGEFKNGLCDGQGTCYFFDGSMYVGQWKEHKFEGNGVLYNTDLFITYQVYNQINILLMKYYFFQDLVIECLVRDIILEWKTAPCDQ